MGKRLIHQRRGRGTPAHRVASHRFKDKIRYRSYDALEKEGSIKGKVIDIVHDPARTAPIAEVKFENGEKNICLEVRGANACGCIRAEFYLLDENNDMELVKEEFFTSDRFHIRLKIRSYESYMIKFKQEE